MDIEKIVKALNFDNIDDDMFAEVFTKKQIIKDFSYEEAIPNPFETLPKDYLWYLENYGCRTVRNMEYQVQIDDNTNYIVSFDGLVSPQEACKQYRYETAKGPYEYRQKDKDEYQGKMLVMDINDEVGSLWQFPSKGDCRKYDLAYQASFVAPNFITFIQLVKPSYAASAFKEVLLQNGFKETLDYSNVWKKNTLTAKEQLNQCLVDYEKNSNSNYTIFKNHQDFFDLLLNNPKKIKVNEARAVELRFLSNGWTAKNQEEFLDKIQRIRNVKDNLNYQRANAEITNLKETEFRYWTTKYTHHFYSVKVKSTLNGLKHKEEFVFYIDPNTTLLSLVKRLHVAMENKKEWKESYPKLKSANEIWKLLGKKFDIHFIDTQTFDLQFEYLPDDEHGIEISVTDGKLKVK